MKMSLEEGSSVLPKETDIEPMSRRVDETTLMVGNSAQNTVETFSHKTFHLDSHWH